MKCIWCKNDAAIGKKKCEQCLKKDRERSTLKRQKRKNLGLCKFCTNSVNTGTLCDDCKAKKRQNNKTRYTSRKSAGLCTDCGEKCTQAKCPQCLKKHRDFNSNLRQKVIAGYGGQCSCCGETEKCFLQLDHVLNNGSEERKQFRNSRAVYLKVLNENFPDSYQILCANCNFGRHLNNGICPHNQK